jgi:hypothetical protein
LLGSALLIVPLGEKNPGVAGVSDQLMPDGSTLDPDDIGGLKALRTLLDVEGYRVPFGQGLETLGLDGGEMNEDVLATILGNETEPLCVIEPLDNPFCHCCVSSSSNDCPVRNGRRQSKVIGFFRRVKKW